MACVAALLLEPSASLITLGAESVEELQTYGTLLLGVLTGAMAAAGGVSGSAALYVGTAFFNALLTAAVTAVFLPMLWMLLALSIAHAVDTDDEEMDAFLFSLGCYAGEPITVISRRRGTCVVSIKAGRYTIGDDLAECIRL